MYDFINRVLNYKKFKYIELERGIDKFKLKLEILIFLFFYN